MKNKIVVATDFSEKSLIAITKAVFLAKKFQYTLDVVHVVEYSIFHDSKKEKKAGRDALAKFMEKNFPNPEIEIQQFCYVGSIKDLCDHAEERGCSLMCIGATGENNNISEILLGSTTKQIIKKSSVPILVVKNHSLSDYANIFSPTDFSDSSIKVVKIAKKIFSDAKFIFYHMISRPFEVRLGHYGANDEEIEKYNKKTEEQAKEESRTFLSNFNDKNEVVLDSGILSYTRLLSVAESKNASLIALPTSGKISFFAIDVLENSQTDVLIWKV